MSAPDVASASTPLERDARQVMAHDRGVAPGEIAPPLRPWLPPGRPLWPCRSAIQFALDKRE